jgi:hypothetical protein
MNIISGSGAVYTDPTNTTIQLTIVTDTLGTIPISVNASDNLTSAIFADCLAGKYGTIAAYVAPVATPNAVAFEQAVKVAVGGIIAANALMVAYPAFWPAVASSTWGDVQKLLKDALSKNIINQTQYNAIKADATTYHIPISL